MDRLLKMIGGIIASVVVLAALLAIPWLIQGSDFFLYKVFAPKYEGVRRETFEQSKAFNQGMIQELQDMQFEYAKADDKHKAAMASIILHRAADFDEAKLPTDLRQFIGQLRRERTMPH